MKKITELKKEERKISRLKHVETKICKTHTYMTINDCHSGLVQKDVGSLEPCQQGCCIFPNFFGHMCGRNY